jgi:peroxiredoxin
MESQVFGVTSPFVGLSSNQGVYVPRRWVRPVVGWPQVVLMLAGLYNLVFGVWAVFFPEHYFLVSGVEVPRYPALWQCIGMIVGLYGVAYFIASTDILRFWPIVLIGLLGKIFGPVGYFFNVTPHSMPEEGAWILLSNDFVWWIPFVLILLQVKRSHKEAQRGTVTKPSSLTHLESCLQRSIEAPMLIFFVRHLGCTFCRQVLKNIAAHQERFSESGISIGLVHMGPAPRAEKMVETYGITGLELIEDKESFLYELLGFPKANLWQAFGFGVIKKAVPALCVDQCGIGHLSGDGFQLGGALYVEKGEAKIIHQQSDAGDLLNIEQFLQQRAQSRTT